MDCGRGCDLANALDEILLRTSTVTSAPNSFANLSLPAS
jgi:hypothetical protein